MKDPTRLRVNASSDIICVIRIFQLLDGVFLRSGRQERKRWLFCISSVLDWLPEVIDSGPYITDHGLLVGLLTERICEPEESAQAYGFQLHDTLRLIT